MHARKLPVIDKPIPRVNAMPYVTQGTIGLELRAPNDALFFVIPTADYAVKHAGKPYTVFVDTQSKPLQSRLFEIAHPFECKEAHFIESLRGAAFNRAQIEITMDPNCAKIESLTIPASS